MSNNPFDPYQYPPSKGMGGKASQEDLMRIFDALNQKGMISNHKTQNSQTIINLQKLARGENDKDLLSYLKQNDVMKNLLESGELGATLAVMMKNPNIHKSIVFLTGQAHASWGNKNVIARIGKGLVGLDIKRQKEVYGLLFHDFSSLGTDGRKMLFQIMFDTNIEGAQELVSLIDGDIAWKKDLRNITPQALCFVDKNIERFVVDKNEWDHIVMCCIFSYIKKLDFGQGTGWVGTMLNSIDDDKRGELLYSYWGRNILERGARGTEEMAILEPFLSHSDIAYLSLSYLKQTQPSLGKRMQPLIEKSLLLDAVMDDEGRGLGKHGAGRKM